jgi:hypothetical protein
LATVCSLSVYVPALTKAFVTEVEPLVPEIVEGPAGSEREVRESRGPTVVVRDRLDEVRCDATSSLLIVHVTLLPKATLTWPTRTAAAICATPLAGAVVGDCLLAERVQARADQ